ncbi:MAG TPA: hypothetical protein VFH65_12235 [Mycobacterium sp.]|nr:hypothetical protein [Mycobacterium sp.]
MQVATSACFVASGLFMCGLGGALAFAEPSPAPENPGVAHTIEVLGGAVMGPPPLGPRGDSGDGPKKDSDGDDNNSKPHEGPGDGDDPGDEDPGNSGENGNGGENGGNPGNGNCGNEGSNGNAQGCGGGTETETTDPTETTKTTTSQTTTSQTTTSQTTTSRTTTTRTTTETTETTETTTETTETTATTTTATTTTSPPSLPGPGGGGGGGGGGFEPPSGRPEPPQMQLPPKAMPPIEPAGPSVVSAPPGLAIAAGELPLAPITLPVIVAPALGAGGGAPAGPANPALPAAPRVGVAEPPAGREPLPANVGSNAAVPASSYRIGYAEYLRTAGIPQVAALAVPGVAGMLVLTGAGGLVGYRQAKAGHAVRTGGTARFVN